MLVLKTEKVRYTAEMLGFLFHTLLYNPFYIGLIFFISVIPGGDAGLAVIILTIVVKLALFSLSYSSIQAQFKMRELEPEIQALKDRYKDDRQQQAVKIMEFYKANHLNPFSSFLVVLLQIPVIFALYFVFVRGGLPEINHTLLYSFTPLPPFVSMRFLGLLDISQKSIILAVSAGLSQFFQAKLLMPARPVAKSGGTSLREDFARSMHLQMRYVLPVIVGVISYTFASAVALYWTVSNLFSIGQELFVRKRMSGKRTNISAQPSPAIKG